MEIEITKIPRAADLPDAWDHAAEEYFQTREFLNHTEKYNPCNQRYYLLSRYGDFETGVVVYSLRLDLFTYLGIPSPFRMTIAGIPCSVSAGGIVGNPAYVNPIVRAIKTEEKGLLIFLNLAPGSVLEEMISGRTLPTIVLTNHFSSWEDYLGRMRADYRRRVSHCAAPFSEIQVKPLACSCFDGEMYGQYLAVLKRSKGKLETLSLEFFQNLPASFHLTACYSADVLVGWYLTTTYHRKFYFFLGGVDYRLNRRFNTYFNLLLHVVSEGVERKAATIDLGQTAETPKLRMGGRLVEKTMAGTHSNKLMSKLMKAAKPLLEYAAATTETHVFKETR